MWLQSFRFESEDKLISNSFQFYFEKAMIYPTLLLINFINIKKNIYKKSIIFKTFLKQGKQSKSKYHENEIHLIVFMKLRI